MIQEFSSDATSTSGFSNSVAGPTAENPHNPPPPPVSVRLGQTSPSGFARFISDSGKKCQQYLTSLSIVSNIAADLRDCRCAYSKPEAGRIIDDAAG
jgi:hypothetical protein